MALFSQRKGIKPLIKPPQVDDLDRETRNQIWTVLQTCIFDKWSGEHYDNNSRSVENLYKLIWTYHFKLPLDSTPSFEPDYPQSVYKTLRNLTVEGEWHDVFDLVEFIVRNMPNQWLNQLTAFINHIFERENVGYRLIGKEIIEITDPIETESIETALSTSKNSIRLHLTKSLELLSDRKNPDYRNSIKESISAVESLCKVISGKSNGTLGECLKIIQNRHPMHKAFQSSLNSLYGYTSDEGGIRHALTEESLQPTFADAKFMLVSCTAFVNYLLTIAAEENISLSEQ